MKPAFDDEGQPVPVTEFDYEAVDGQAEQPAPERPGTRPDVEAFTNSMQWLCSDKARAYFPERFYRYLAALSWVVIPQAYEGKSLAQLGRELGVSKQALSKHTAKVSRVFGIRNRAQRAHGGRWRGQPPG